MCVCVGVGVCVGRWVGGKKRIVIRSDYLIMKEYFDVWAYGLVVCTLERIAIDVRLWLCLENVICIHLHRA